MSPSLISHHLNVLESAGVIERRKDGLWTLNRLRRDELTRQLDLLARLLQPSA
jgi:DNA-binding transcriptional ArsR family regulator